MSESLTGEIAHKMAHHPSALSREWFLEIVEAVMLSVVAIVTAWCGYEAARWDGRQAYLYGVSARLNVQAASKATEGGQLRLLDVVTFNTWIRLEEDGKDRLAHLYEGRFSPEYKIAFDAWIKTDPFHNPKAPAGPVRMPEYHNALLDQSVALSRQAGDAFAEGVEAREIAEFFVQRTVLLATVLFITALAQRFRIRKVRVALLMVAAAMLVYQLIELSGHPRL